MNNTIKPNNKLIKCIKPIIVLLLFLVVTFISYFYLIIASMADQVISYSRFFLYTSPLYLLIIIISFIPKYKLSWAPISLLLFSISSLTIFRYSNNSPSFLNLPIILGISVLFDIIYFGLSIYEENKVLKIVKKIVLGLIIIGFTLVGVYFLKELLTGNWGGTPFASQLNTFYIPFSIIIILIGLIYYLFMLVKPNNLINSKYLGYLKGTVALITFILALVLISIPMF